MTIPFPLPFPLTSSFPDTSVSFNLVNPFSLLPVSFIRPSFPPVPLSLLARGLSDPTFPIFSVLSVRGVKNLTKSLGLGNESSESLLSKISHSLSRSRGSIFSDLAVGVTQRVTFVVGVVRLIVGGGGERFDEMCLG